jgi:hypothetical protein
MSQRARAARSPLCAAREALRVLNKVREFAAGDDDVDELFCDEMTTQPTGGAQTYKTENW